MRLQRFANIGPAGRRKRLLTGAAMLAVGVSLALALISTGVPRPWRLTLFLPFWVGALGLLQARANT